MEDGDGDEVLVFPLLERDRERHVRERFGLFFGDANMGAVCSFRDDTVGQLCSHRGCVTFLPSYLSQSASISSVGQPW